MSGMGRARERGTALIVVVGVLFLMAALAVSGVRLASMEKHAAANQVAAVKAHFVAEAGVEMALARLARKAIEDRVDFVGQEWHCDEDPRTSLARLQRPSFPDGRAGGRPFSRLVPHPQHLQPVTLRITDLASRADVGSLHGSEGSVRLLDNLGRIVPGLGRGIGTLLAARSGRGGYRTRQDLARVLGHERLARLAPWITLNAWRDHDVVDPAPARGSDRFGLVKAAPRAPINVNTAPRPILQAVFAGIAARDPSGVEIEVDDELAARLAGDVVARRRIAPFRRWDQFAEWLAARLDAHRPARPRLAEVVLAGVSPHPRILAINPDAHLAYRTEGGRVVWDRPVAIDRSRLLQWTVELCFSSMGRYRIESLGRVIAGGEVLAAAALEIEASVYDVLRHTTQQQLAGAMTVGQGVLTWPESYDERRRKASPLVGALQLVTRAADPQDPDLALETPAPGAFAASVPAGLAGRATLRSVTLADGGDRICDGIFGRAGHERSVVYPSEQRGRTLLPARSGSIEMWIKPDRDAVRATCGLLFASTPLSEDAGIQTLVYLHRGQLRASRTYFRGWGGVGGRVPVGTVASTVVDRERRVRTVYSGREIWAEVQGAGTYHQGPYLGMWGLHQRINLTAVLGNIEIGTPFVDRNPSDYPWAMHTRYTVKASHAQGGATLRPEPQAAIFSALLPGQTWRNSTDVHADYQQQYQRAAAATAAIAIMEALYDGLPCAATDVANSTWGMPWEPRTMDQFPTRFPGTPPQLTVRLYAQNRYSTVVDSYEVRRVVSRDVYGETIPYLDVVDETVKGGTLAPFVAGRVEIVHDGAAAWRAHEWRHLRLAWRDGFDLTLEIDGARAPVEVRLEDATRRFRSRVPQRADGIVAGPFLLERTSPEPGIRTPDLRGTRLRFAGDVTIDRVTLRAGAGQGSTHRFLPEDGLWRGRFALAGAARPGTVALIDWEGTRPAGSTVQARLVGASLATPDRLALSAGRASVEYELRLGPPEAGSRETPRVEAVVMRLIGRIVLYSRRTASTQ